MKWATVTVLDESGRRHSLDVRAESSFDAAHLFLSAVKGIPPDIVTAPIPVPTSETTFEVAVDGKVHKVSGAALQDWISKRRSELRGPKGYLFSQRPVLD